MKRSACNTQLNLKDFMSKARKVMATAQSSMVTEAVGAEAAECHPDQQSKLGGKIVLSYNGVHVISSTH